MNWKTEVCAYRGNVYTSCVNSDDTTISMDYVYAVVPFVNGSEDKAAVNAAVEAAMKAEENYCD